MGEWGVIAGRVTRYIFVRKTFGRRLVALSLFILMLIGANITTASALVADAQLHAQQAVSDKTGKPFDQPTTTKQHSFTYPGGMRATTATNKAAADTTGSGVLGALSNSTAITGEALKGIAAKPKITPHELTDKRTATTSVSINANGTLTQKNYITPQFFKKNGQWTTIDTGLVEDTNAGDSGNVFGKVLGKIESLFSSPTTFTVKDNDWQARFAPSDAANGMVRIKKGDSQVGFAPVGTKKVAPVVTTDNGQQTVHYYDLWPGVNVEYTVKSAEVKENIIIKDKDAANSVAFRLIGANLEKQASDGKSAQSYTINGALNNEFAVAPANLILNNFGFVSDSKVLSQTYQNGVVKLSVDKAYLQSLPARAFPAVIDPSVFTSTFGTRAGGNYVSFKTDGTICYSNVCNPYAGSLYDSNYALQYWRSAFYAPYDQFRNTSNILTNATLHLTQRNNAGFWTGTYDTHSFYVGHATCLSSFNNCLEGNQWNAAATFATVGDIDVTNIYQAMISRGDYGAWLMIGGEDGTTSSFKNFDPDNSYVTFSYGGPPAAPSIASPTTNQVFVDPQPSFKVNAMPNPNGSTPLQYEILVSSGQGANGALIDSGRLGASQWTIPDGILQDGSTYYVQARSYDPITNSYSNWGMSVPFHINMRTGKDNSQSIDNLGPVNVDLATGNVSTGIGSHASKALGGGLGVNLDYNTPLKSRNGLVGQYWNVSSGYPGNVPSSPPTMTRVDQNVDFAWDTGSPSSGIINNDWYFVHWTGYFVAPTTGTYYFGGNNDDILAVSVNNQLLYNNGGCYTGICYGSSITLQAGQVAPIDIQYEEATGPSYAHLYVKGAVDEQIVPNDWLQTGVRPISNQHGLTGSYFSNQDGTNSFSTNNPMVMKRVDPYLSFDWGTGAPVPNGPQDFLVRWSGYVTVPVSGTYNFGTNSDDGSKITIGTSNTVVYNDWTTHGPTEGYGTGYAMTANTPVPITIEYFDAGGPASFQFKVQGAVAQQIVPTDWLSPSAQVLPAGWTLDMNASGGVAYDRLQANQNSVILTDASGSTHEYAWTGTGYKPPVNEDGQLVRNADGTFTLQDIDGSVYVFGVDGTLSSVTSAPDDRKPAALQYEYQSLNGGPTHLYRIKDGLDSTRNATLYYSGQTDCGTAPTGFDANAPAGMLCAVKTNDGRATYFYYMQGQLARGAAPGNALTDYRYEAVTNASGATIGYRMNAVRNSLTMDAIAAGVRADDNTVNSTIGYDNLGRAVNVTQPAPTAGANRLQQTIEYLPGALDKSYAGMTQEHVVNASEPNGFTRRIKYDNLFRTIEDTNNLNLSTTTQWDPLKDLMYSSTDPTGLKSTTVYDDEDRAVSSYGPAPAAWFDSTNPHSQTPLSSYASQVAHTDTTYDGSIVGPSVAWYDYSKQATNTSGILSGAPKLHTTGINTTTPGVLSYDFTSPPITASTGAQGIGFSATGKLRLPNGTYTMNADTTDGIRIWVDDQLLLDNQWIDSSTRTVTSNSFTVSDATPKRFRLDVYRKTGSTGTLQVRIQQQGGFAYTNDWTSYLKPDYSLPTSTTTYDSTLGNSTTAINYGSNPELGLTQSVTTDPAGLNLATTNTYETQGATNSFLRETSQSLPGSPSSNPTYTYAYYGPTETRDNPCTTTVEAYKQAGFAKTKTEADPDGAGSQTARVSEMVYDDAGRVVASRYNSDAWTCNTYDSRGRISTTTVPAFNGEQAQTTNYDYAVGGNPLETTTWDGGGWLVTWTDLLGRTTKYRDVHDDETTTTYDDFGKITQRVSPLGTESYDYDTYSRLTNQKLDGTIYATVTYDAYNRVDHVSYPNAGQMKVTPGRDTLQRTNSVTYVLGDGTTAVSDTVNLTQNNKIQNDIVQSGSNQLWSTYGYDQAGRLTSANIGPHTYAYGYGTQATSCGTANNMNPNSGKNGNRTSQTIDGATTTYCYDYADRLVSSTDPTANYTEYDPHGNMTYIGTGTTPLRLCYDSLDRNYCLVSYDSSGNGNAMYYGRDTAGRITYREHDTITAHNWNMDAQNWYGYTGSGGSPDFVFNSTNGVVTTKYLHLAGGVLVTITPQDQTNNQKQYGLQSALGHTLLTTNALGVNTSNGNGPLGTFTYDPFGNILPGSNHPANAQNGSYGYGGSRQKITETTLALAPIQMGARVYLPTIGRFTSTDPVQGGNANAYVYVLDPVNGNDYSGRCFSLQGGSCNAASYLQPALTAAVLQPARTVTYYQAAKTFDRIQSSTAPRLTAVAAVTVPPRDNSRAMGVATVTGLGGSTVAKAHTSVSSTLEGAISSVIPPAGYSFKGFANSVLEGCAVTGGAFAAVGMLAAPFSDGMSIPVAAYTGCKVGAGGAAIQYFITGDSESQDTSLTGDMYEFLRGSLR